MSQPFPDRRQAHPTVHQLLRVPGPHLVDGRFHPRPPAIFRPQLLRAAVTQCSAPTVLLCPELEVQEDVATVQMPDTSVEEWSLASLPVEVMSGDCTRVTVDGGDLAVVLLSWLAGLRA